MVVELVPKLDIDGYFPNMVLDNIPKKGLDALNGQTSSLRGGGVVI